MTRKPTPDANSASETQITARLLLRVHQIVVDHGSRADGGHVYEGVTTTLDTDGYGLSVSDGVVTARVMFHNKVAIDSPRRRALAAFRKRLSALEDRCR